MWATCYTQAHTDKSGMPFVVENLSLWKKPTQTNEIPLLDHFTEGRKKDKGQGLLLAMALMFGKMMAVLGLGGIGALAMKALGVAMVALMMAGMLGLKAAAHQGNESSHSISYVTGEGHHHKRRRRAAGGLQVVSEQPQGQQQHSSPYRGWLRT